MTKKAEDLQRRIRETQEKAEKYARDNSIHTHTSEFRGCKKCGSKLATKYIKGENCPLCGNDLRSETVVKTLNGYAEKIRALTKEFNIESQKVGKAEAKPTGRKTSPLQEAYNNLIEKVDYVIEERNGPDFKEVIYSMGGDVIQVRICSDGSVYER